MKKILTLGCEIVEQLKPKDARWNKPQELTISCLGLQWQPKAEKVSYWWSPDESVDGLLESNDCGDLGPLQRMLNRADLVITFNGERFDFPLMEAAGFDMSHAKVVGYDIMTEFLKVAGHRISLDALAKSLVGRGKSSTGLLAPQLWRAANYLYLCSQPLGNAVENPFPLPPRGSCQEGAKFLYQAVINYCLDDVALTREIFDRLVDWNGEATYFNPKFKTDRTVVLDLPKGFGSSPLIDSERKRPSQEGRYLVASDSHGVASMIPACVALWQIAAWRVRYKGCQIVEREVRKDEFKFDLVDIPF